MAVKYGQYDSSGSWNPLRDVKGRFASGTDVELKHVAEKGANRGNQRFLADRYETAGVKLSLPSVKTVLALPVVYDHVAKVTEEKLAMANRLATTVGALYGAIIYNNRPELGPVGVVFCDNYKSVIDDRYHATLIKVKASHARHRW